MNINNILNFTNKVIGSYKKIEDNLYVVENKLLNKLAGIYYIDLNKDAVSNFEKRQEDILGNEYYNNPGFLQWNYYYILLQDNISKDKKIAIESDDKFARKFVFTEDEFFDFFKVETLTNNDTSSDLIKSWNDKLEKCGLNELSSDSPISNAVERFIKNESLTNKVIKSTKIDIEKINQIKKLQLKNGYRSFPKLKDYEFGKVNLICGVNGTGKTSLLESIEYLLTGNSSRNMGINYPNNSIEAIINDGKKIKFKNSEKNAGVYKLRNKFWYNVDLPRNVLTSYFNKYNFYNSDAGYEFTNSSNKAEILNALNNLIYGSEYSTIKERAGKFYKSLNTQFNKLDKEKQSNISELKSKNDFIKSLAKNIKQNSVTLTIDQLRELNIKSTFSELNSEDTVKKLTQILDDVNEINDSFSLLKVDSFFEYKNKHEQFKKDRKSVEEYKKFVSLNTLKIETIKSKRDLNTQAESKLEKLKFYFFPFCRNLDLIDKHTFAIKEQIKRIEAININLQNIDLNSLKLHATFIDKFNVYSEKVNYLKKEINFLEQNLITTKNTLDSNNNELSEIKRLGNSYISRNKKKINSCPLCDTDFRVDDLIERIQKSNASVENTLLIELNTRIDLLKSDCKVAEKSLFNLSKIRESYISINFENQDYDISLKEIIESINSFISDLPDKKNQLFDLENQQREIKLKGVSVAERNSIHDFISKNFNNLKISSIEELEALFATIKTENKKLEIEQKVLIDEIETKQKKTIDSIKSVKASNIDEIEDLINEVADYYEEIPKELKKLESKIIIEEEIKIKSLIKKLSNIIYSITRRLEQDRDFKLLTKTKDEKEIIENKITYLNKEIERYISAFKVLEEITESSNNEEINSFFKNNLGQIREIFMTLHAPKEFKNIQFKINDNSLHLVDSTGMERGITEISTGQRSALALSMFLYLNQKLVNAPDIIIFDDPIAYVDDLNVLSFLDFLRYFVCKNNKQLFFATANRKLANLFQKKFQFLGEEDFKIYNLERGND